MSCCLILVFLVVEENWVKRNVNKIRRSNEICETRRKTGTVAECDGWRDKSATEVGNITCGPGISFHSGVDVGVCVFFIIACVYPSSFFEEDWYCLLYQDLSNDISDHFVTGGT